MHNNREALSRQVKLAASDHVQSDAQGSRENLLLADGQGAESLSELWDMIKTIYPPPVFFTPLFQPRVHFKCTLPSEKSCDFNFLQQSVSWNKSH